jgi:hypothetical protein
MQIKDAQILARESIELRKHALISNYFFEIRIEKVVKEKGKRFGLLRFDVFLTKSRKALREGTDSVPDALCFSVFVYWNHTGSLTHLSLPPRLDFKPLIKMSAFPRFERPTLGRKHPVGTFLRRQQELAGAVYESL